MSIALNLSFKQETEEISNLELKSSKFFEIQSFYQINTKIKISFRNPIRGPFNPATTFFENKQIVLRQIENSGSM